MDRTLKLPVGIDNFEKIRKSLRKESKVVQTKKQY